MSRLQLALNVDDLDAAIAFYSTLFQTQPAKRRPGYANFAVEDPALKLVLFENPGAGGTLNHLGVEVASSAEVVAQTRRLAAHGLRTSVQENTTCCHALQDKVWVEEPGSGAWEIYTVLADATPELEGMTAAGEPACSQTCSEQTSGPQGGEQACCAAGPDRKAGVSAG